MGQASDPEILVASRTTQTGTTTKPSTEYMLPPWRGLHNLSRKGGIYTYLWHKGATAVEDKLDPVIVTTHDDKRADKYLLTLFKFNQHLYREEYSNQWTCQHSALLKHGCSKVHRNQRHGFMPNFAQTGQIKRPIKYLNLGKKTGQNDILILFFTYC
jgi:hypothetical protein